MRRRKSRSAIPPVLDLIPQVNLDQVRCPDACATPESEKGCHFREGPDAFTCQKCKLRVLKLFIGYEITATDLDQLFRTGVTPDEKTLKRRDGSAFQARHQRVSRWTCGRTGRAFQSSGTRSWHQGAGA